MLNENQVIDYIVAYLKQNGYIIDIVANTHQKGPDIIAQKVNRKLIIEAKGEISSKSNALIPFKKNNTGNHIAIAIFQTLLNINKYGDADFALALPKNSHYQNLINSVRVAFKKMNIQVYWVDDSGTVSIQ